MATRRVLIELRHSPTMRAAASARSVLAASGDLNPLAAASGITIDARYGVVEVPREITAMANRDLTTAFAVEGEDDLSTYLVRGEVDENAIEAATMALRDRADVIGIYADGPISPMPICPGSSPLGTDVDVEQLLDVETLRAKGMDGRNVAVAIVDTGLNIAFLQSRGKPSNFDAARSWVPDPTTQTPGDLSVDHGCMCAFDAMIAAPDCTLLDIAVLLSTTPGGTIMEGFLSDAVAAYAHLLNTVAQPDWPYSALVVNNSWGMFHPSWDFALGHPGNYSDNANHPFNRIVGTLERAGADILFAAGNCGRECPDGRCQGLTNAGVFGANSHPQVTCVAGVDTTRQRVGYSTSGPGRLMRSKPDVCAYTHFAGSTVFTADGGTSAATPVVAGLVAAVRTRLHYDASKPVTHPAAMRWLLMRTADDLGTSGFDFDFGHGIVNGRKLATAVKVLSAVKEGKKAAQPVSREVPTYMSRGVSPVQPAEPRTRTAGAS
jgi:subtilisin family serine protease